MCTPCMVRLGWNYDWTKINMFVPKTSKYKKQHKGKNFKKISKLLPALRLTFGVVGLRSIENGKLTSKQIESMRTCINKIIKKKGKLFLNVFPQTPVSTKPTEVRMGKGKGNVSYWVAKVRFGARICEIKTSSPSIALKALKACQFRLPIKTNISSIYK